MRIFSLALAGCLAIVTSPAHGQDLKALGRAVFAKYRDSVVTVQLVVKSKMNFPGLPAGDSTREAREEATGVVIDPTGLTVVSLSSIDPMGTFQGMMGDFGGGGGEDEGFKLKMESEITDVKLLTSGGNEFPAEVVLRDKDLDLAFLRPKSKPTEPLPLVDLSAGATVDILDEVIAINRLGRVAGRAYAVAIERISAVVKRPRLFYVPGGGATSSGLGSPAFTPDGRLVGIFVMRSSKSGGDALGMLSAQGTGMTIILLPAEDIRKTAAQVPPAGGEGK
jgi:S1-C subfamily serine protease